MSEKAGSGSPHLAEEEREQAAQSKLVAARVIHEILREEGETELSRPLGALLWSGLAAGLSMGFSFLTLALLKAQLGPSPNAHLVASLGYAVGFLIVVLGKQQLFTESTLTATLPVMHRPSLGGLGRVGRIWGAVLAANVVGTFAFGWLLARPGVMTPEVSDALLETAKRAFGASFLTGAGRALFSGWLIALMVWLLPASGSAAAFVIAALTYVVALGEFPHIIAGSAEAAYAVIRGEASLGDYLWRFFLPTLVGNTIGGTALAALLNHAPVAHDFAQEAEG